MPLFVENRSPRVLHFGTLEIQKSHQKSTFWEHRSALWAPKMHFQKGFRKKAWNMWWKIAQTKWEDLGWKSILKLCPVQWIHGFRHFRKSRKLMPKWLPKCMKNAAKSTTGAPRVELFIDFIDFGPCLKNVVFWMSFREVQKSQKSSRGAPKGRQPDFDYSPGVSQRQQGPYTVRKKDRFDSKTIHIGRRDPDTPLGRRPGEFCKCKEIVI